LEQLSGLITLYACLFLVEGVGLFMRRRWAEYLTVIATASFIPLEIYEIIKESSLPRVSLLVVNSGIVIYLSTGLRRKAARQQSKAGARKMRRALENYVSS
jgi:uncharacterized membrane protein (DUF2068 family)